MSVAVWMIGIGPTGLRITQGLQERLTQQTTAREHIPLSMVTLLDEHTPPGDTIESLKLDVGAAQNSLERSRPARDGGYSLNWLAPFAGSAPSYKAGSAPRYVERFAWFRALEAGSGSSVYRLFARTVTQLPNVTSLTVFLAADLGESLGSSLLVDVAHFTRRVAQELRSSLNLKIFVLSVLPPDSASTTQQSRAFAAIRELERFMGSAPQNAFAYPLTYLSQSNAADRVWRGELNARPFDLWMISQSSTSIESYINMAETLLERNAQQYFLDTSVNRGAGNNATALMTTSISTHSLLLPLNPILERWTLRYFQSQLHQYLQADASAAVKSAETFWTRYPDQEFRSFVQRWQADPRERQRWKAGLEEPNERIARLLKVESAKSLLTESKTRTNGRELWKREGQNLIKRYAPEGANEKTQKYLEERVQSLSDQFLTYTAKALETILESTGPIHANAFLSPQIETLRDAIQGLEEIHEVYASRLTSSGRDYKEKEDDLQSPLPRLSFFKDTILADYQAELANRVSLLQLYHWTSILPRLLYGIVHALELFQKQLMAWNVRLKKLMAYTPSFPPVEVSTVTTSYAARSWESAQYERFTANSASPLQWDVTPSQPPRLHWMTRVLGDTDDATADYQAAASQIQPLFEGAAHTLTISSYLLETQADRAQTQAVAQHLQEAELFHIPLIRAQPHHKHNAILTVFDANHEGSLLYYKHLQTLLGRSTVLERMPERIEMFSHDDPLRVTYMSILERLNLRKDVSIYNALRQAYLAQRDRASLHIFAAEIYAARYEENLRSDMLSETIRTLIEPLPQSRKILYSTSVIDLFEQPTSVLHFIWAEAEGLIQRTPAARRGDPPRMTLNLDGDSVQFWPISEVELDSPFNPLRAYLKHCAPVFEARLMERWSAMVGRIEEELDHQARMKASVLLRDTFKDVFVHSGGTLKFSELPPEQRHAAVNYYIWTTMLVKLGLEGDQPSDPMHALKMLFSTMEQQRHAELLKEYGTNRFAT